MHQPLYSSPSIALQPITTRYELYSRVAAPLAINGTLPGTVGASVISPTVVVLIVLQCSVIAFLSAAEALKGAQAAVCRAKLVLLYIFPIPPHPVIHF